MSRLHPVTSTLGLVALGSVVVVGVALAPSTAHAGIDACANVYVAAEAQCEWVPEQETCRTRCEPTAVHSSCAARLYTECEGQCSATAEVTCTAECAESCVPECTDLTVDQPPNCMGLCMSDCQMDCNDACADAPDQGACRSTCAHTCSETCHDQCDGAEEQSCDPVCGLVCAGSCAGQANMDCQISCQSQTFAECETTVVSECQTDCESSGGALFCDGSYVAHSSSITECVHAIQAELDLEIKGWAEGECVNPEGIKDLECKAEAGLSCNVAEGQELGGLALLGLAGLIWIPVARRRRAPRG